VSGSLTITTRDAFGNVIVSSALNIAVSSSPPLQKLTLAFVSSVWTVTYQSTRAGVYTLSATIDQIPISGTPLHLTVLPGNANPNHFIATVPAIVVTGRVASASVTAYDTWDNQLITVPTSTLMVSITRTPPLGPEIPINVTAMENGLYSVTFITSVAGSYDIAMTADGVTVPNTPIRFDATAPIFSPQYSSMTGALTEAFTNVKNVLNIVLRDANNLPWTYVCMSVMFVDLIIALSLPISH